MRKRRREWGKFYWIFRYLILLALGLGIQIFYFIFTPITIYLTAIILKLFGEVIVQDNLILFNSLLIEIIPACVAGAAYYLLLALNLTTPMKIDRRIKSVLFLFVAFLLFNLIRIIIFIFLALAGYRYFDETHSLVWHLGSTLLVVLIWFANVKIFRIKEIPVLSDFRVLVEGIK